MKTKPGSEARQLKVMTARQMVFLRRDLHAQVKLEAARQYVPMYEIIEAAMDVFLALPDDARIVDVDLEEDVP